MHEDNCPLCNKRPRHRKRVLYGVPICKKCYYAFANRRQIAYLIDAVLWQLVIIFPLGILVGILSVVSSNSTASSGASPLLLLDDLMPYPLFLLFAMKDGFEGRSLGKLICGVMVLDQETYQPLRFFASFKRNLVLIIPIVPLIVAFLLQKGYRWGDDWAKSKVVWTKYRNHPLFTGQLACASCQYDLRGCVSDACPECGCPIPEHTLASILQAGPPTLTGSTTAPN